MPPIDLQRGIPVVDRTLATDGSTHQMGRYPDADRSAKPFCDFRQEVTEQHQ